MDSRKGNQSREHKLGRDGTTTSTDMNRNVIMHLNRNVSYSTVGKIEHALQSIKIEFKTKVSSTENQISYDCSADQIVCKDETNKLQTGNGNERHTKQKCRR